MRYTVVWSTAAQDQLAEIWLSSNDRAGVTKATARIDKLLATHPIDCGTDFYGDCLLVVEPLQVVYKVSDDDMLVEVLQVI